MTRLPDGHHRLAAAATRPVGAARVPRADAATPPQPAGAQSISRGERFKKVALDGVIGAATTAVPFVGISALGSYVTAAEIEYMDGPLHPTGKATMRAMHREGVAYASENFHKTKGVLTAFVAAGVAGGVVTSLTGKRSYGMAAGTLLGGGLSYAFTRNLKISLAMSGAGLIASAATSYIAKKRAE